MEILQFFQKYQARMDALPPGITGKDYLLYMMCAPFLHDLANTQEGEGYSAAHITRCLQLAERRYTSDPARKAKGANRRELLAYQRGLWRETQPGCPVVACIYAGAPGRGEAGDAPGLEVGGTPACG